MAARIPDRAGVRRGMDNQVRTGIEYIVIKLRNACRNVYIPQDPAADKSLPPDFFQSVREINTPKTEAPGKRMAADFLYPFRKPDFRKRAAALESLASYLCDAFRNLQAA